MFFSSVTHDTEGPKYSFVSFSLCVKQLEIVTLFVVFCCVFGLHFGIDDSREVIDLDLHSAHSIFNVLGHVCYIKNNLLAIATIPKKF